MDYFLITKLYVEDIIDSMAVFLGKMGIKNIKISNISHVWNLVYLNGAWFHLDLTWDDPVVNTNENLLLHNYFLITNTDLQRKILLIINLIFLL